jgi:hypothetical protein
MAFFISTVNTNGYEWRMPYVSLVEWAKYDTDDQRRDASALVAKPSASPAREYNTEEYPGLFLTFLKTEPTEQATLRFANRYGPLGLSENNEIIRSWSDVAKEHDTFAGWKSEIAAMRMVFDSWKTQDTDWEWLQQQIDGLLTQHRVCPRFGRDVKRGKWTLRFAPSNLAGALWLQLAESIAGDKRWEGCPGCGQWIEVKTAERRADRRYCSEACRAKAYRARKQRSIQLALAGRTVEQIAAEIGADVEKVKQWTKQRG